MSLNFSRIIEVKGKEFTVQISDEGDFFAEYGHDQVHAESLKQLIDKLANRIARSKCVNIPVCMWEKDSWNDEPGKVRTGVILGIHGGNNNTLVKFDNEQKSKQVSYGDFFDPKDGDELRRLHEALDAAENAFEHFKKKHRIDAFEKVREALS
jgi:hypothetical protein